MWDLELRFKIVGDSLTILIQLNFQLSIQSWFLILALLELDSISTRTPSNQPHIPNSTQLSFHASPPPRKLKTPPQRH